MTTKQLKECGRCGGGKYHQWKDCPARGAECWRCHKKGHFAVACCSTSSIHNVTQQESSQLDEDVMFLGEVSTE